MENSLYVILALTQVGLLVYYFWYARRKKGKEAESRTAIAKEYPYEALRNIALNTMPGAILKGIPDGEIMVYGVVMDWDMGSDMVTLVAMVTGDASLYVKSGGGIIGSGKYPNVSVAAQRFIAAAQERLSDAVYTTGVDRPAKGCIKFFFLTKKGKYAATEEFRNVDDKTSGWTGLFEEANSMMSEMSMNVSKVE